MKRPGLTEAMRRALVSGSHSPAMQEKLRALGLVAPQRGFLQITPRGQAALAAPRVTAAELAMLERIERGGTPDRIDRVVYALMDKGWMVAGKLSDTGTTALNNVRAASGSPEWKEVL